MRGVTPNGGWKVTISKPPLSLRSDRTAYVRHTALLALGWASSARLRARLADAEARGGVVLRTRQSVSVAGLSLLTTISASPPVPARGKLFNQKQGAGHARRHANQRLGASPASESRARRLGLLPCPTGACKQSRLSKMRR